jgi:hemerythrin
MNLIEWNDAFSVGIDSIDEQHKGLLDLLNKLVNQLGRPVDRKVTEDAVNKLLEYTVFHFSTEEYLMRKADYPEYDAHKAEHEMLVKKASDFFKDFVQQKTDLTEDIVIFLRDWVFNHILKTDMKYRGYLK